MLPVVTGSEVSVLIATRNRAQTLRTTLIEFTKLREAGDWEIIIVDNGSSDETPKVCSEMKHYLPLVDLYEPVSGKSRALNRAINAAQGRLLAFTDDDLSPTPRWTAELIRAANQYETASVFCGPVTPLLEEEAPDWLFLSRFASIAFAIFIPPFKEGPLPIPWLPIGANFAVRASAVTGMRLREDLGPSASDSLMSEDTEFMEQFRKRGDQIIYVPTARLAHRIRNELLKIPTLLERAFMLGRSQVIWKKDVKLVFALSPVERGDDPLMKYETDTMLNYYFGQVCEHVRHYGTAPRQLMGAIAELEWNGDRSSLARTAVEWLCSQPEHIPERARPVFEALGPLEHEDSGRRGTAEDRSTEYRQKLDSSSSAGP